MAYSVKLNESKGFGISLIKMMAEQIAGKVSIERNHCTQFILEFPI